MVFHQIFINQSSRMVIFITQPIIILGILILIRWVCELGTPCSDISPKKMGVPSVFYFVFEITSNVKTDSYCQFRNQFTIALLNKPLSFAVEMTIMALSAIFWFIPLGFYLWFTQKTKFGEEFFEKGVKFAPKNNLIKSQKKLERKSTAFPVKARVYPMDDDEEDEEHSISHNGSDQEDSERDSIESDSDDDDSESDIAAYANPTAASFQNDKIDADDGDVEINGQTFTASLSSLNQMLATDK